MPSLHEVCVWTTPFPPEGMRHVSTSGSPNVCFETNCNGICDGTGGIDGNSLSGLSIYPNPTNGLLTIETTNPKPHTIEIHSLNGQLLYRTKLERPTLQIDLSSFQKGLYFITVRSRDYVRTEKIIKL